MDNLVCPDCGTTYYSAAAKSMIARGERCDCGELLRLVSVPGALDGPEVPAVPVAVPASSPLRNRCAARSGAGHRRRRFTRK